MDQDDELARRAAAGDAAAFTALVRRHEGAVRRFLGRLVRGDGADDLAQDVFVKAWRCAGDWRGEGSYRGWLLRIAWTVFLGSHRVKGRQARRDQMAFEQASAGSSDPGTTIDLSRALAMLDQRERAAALLCFGEGYSHSEAAQIMEIPLGTLKTIVARARTALAAHLEMGS